MIKYISICLYLLLLTACFKGKSVDLIVHNAKIFSINEKGEVFQAMAIKDGKIVELGPERQILNKYSAKQIIDAGSREIYPGFTDAHGHILSLAQQKMSVDLVGVKSFEEMLIRVEKFQQKNNKKFIVGRGWDQSLWKNDELPCNNKLNELFPDIPVILYRIDGHAALVNDYLLDKAQINPYLKILGGIVHVKDDNCTGLLIDNAIDPASALIPPYSYEELSQSIQEIQEELFQFGITGVHEAGIEFEHIEVFKKMIDENKLLLNLNAMLYPTQKNLEFAKKHEIYLYKNLQIRSFKVVGDGALGSRGACLKQPYHDQKNHYGILTTTIEELKSIAEIARKINYQMNTHAIGDSTNRIVLDLIEETYQLKKDHRWRIEHAQVLDPIDILRLAKCGVFPSVQPTHAVSDQRWAKERLGETRLKGAYAYQSILNQTGMIAIGTDFPVESINPFLTIHAAVQRKDSENFPSSGFLPKEAISFEDCIKGMTIWAAMSSFQEKNIGSLEIGKDATFVCLEKPLKSQSQFIENYAFMTFIKGKKVFGE
jgi:predicted amidohydrolase YtcJ